MTNTTLDLTSSTSEYLLKLLSGVPVKDRNVIWNQINRDVKRSVDIWSKIDKENKLRTELLKSAIKPPAKSTTSKI